MTDYLNKEIHVGDTCVFASMAGILHTGKIVGFIGNSVEIGSCNHQGYFEWYVNPKSIAIVTEQLTTLSILQERVKRREL